MIGPDYLVYKLCGTMGTDFCEASTSSLFDFKERSWSGKMRELLGLSEAVYPTIRGCAQIVGTLQEKLAEELGLAPDVEIIAGTGDNPATSISMGLLTDKRPILSLGTSGVLVSAREKVDFSVKGKNILFSFDNQKFYNLVQGAVQSTGSGFGWWINNILQSDDMQGEEKDIDLAKLGESPILFYPHLVGEKTIYSDASVRGAFLGLGTETSRAQMTQAVMEGIAFAVRELMTEMGFAKECADSIKVTGGGAKSALWLQILADVLNVDIEQVSGKAGAAYGIAQVAAQCHTGTKKLEQIGKQAVTVKERFSPREYNVKLYDEKYKKYLRIYQALKTIMGD